MFIKLRKKFIKSDLSLIHCLCLCDDNKLNVNNIVMLPQFTTSKYTD